MSGIEKLMIEAIADFMGLKVNRKLGDNGWSWGGLSEDGRQCLITDKGFFNPLGREEERGDAQTYVVIDYEDMIALEEHLGMHYSLAVHSNPGMVTVMIFERGRHSLLVHITIDVQGEMKLREARARALCEATAALIRRIGKANG